MDNKDNAMPFISRYIYVVVGYVAASIFDKPFCSDSRAAVPTAAGLIVCPTAFSGCMKRFLLFCKRVSHCSCIFSIHYNFN